MLNLYCKRTYTLRIPANWPAANQTAYVRKRTHKKLNPIVYSVYSYIANSVYGTARLLVRNPIVYSVYSYIANSVYGTARLLVRTVPVSKNAHIVFAQP